MWLCISVIAMMLSASADLLAKQIVIAQDALGPLRIKMTVSMLAFALAMLLYALGLGESGLAPWVIVRQHPLIIVATVCNVSQALLYLLALRYIGLSIQESLSGATGMLIFLGMLLANVFSARLTQIEAMLAPARLLPVCVLIVGVLILPNLPGPGGKVGAPAQQLSKGNMLKGIAITCAALLFDAGDSVFSSMVLADEGVGPIDYLLAGCCLSIIFALIMYFIVCRRDGALYNPFARSKRRILCYAGLLLFCTLFYLWGASMDAVRANLLWIAYPVLPIALSALVLKERYSLKQYICIAAIAGSSIVFCLADVLI